MKRVLVVVLLIATLQIRAQEAEINQLMDDWHQAAANADYESYFDVIAEDGYYLGTDESEVWTKGEFQAFCEPYFAQKNTWDFHPKRRKVFLSQDQKMAWFEEVLETWMGPCRGSGVLMHDGAQWQIKQYNLAVLVSNENIKSYLEILAREKK